MENQTCKGMRDLLSGDMLRFRHIEDKFRTCCLKWGYQEVKTPTLEYIHLFTSTGTLTPGMLGKVYSFLDWNGWSGERVVLRPDGTIPIARLYINNLAEQEIARLFYITNIFSFDETGRENRERWQCGVEFLGSAEAAADAEIILLAREVMHNLGFDKLGLRLSHAGLVKALVKELGLSPGEETKMVSRLLDGDWQALTAVKSAKPEIDKLLSSLLDLKGKSSGFLHNAKALSLQASQGIKSNLDDFITIATLLDSLGCNYEIDIKAITGFEYYTGTCFQLLVEGEKVGSGGRYNDLIPLMGGRNVPACGFALYVDPLMNLLPLRSAEGDEPKVLIKAEDVTPEAIELCFSLAKSLRDAGYTTLFDFASQGKFDYWWSIVVPKKKSSPFTITNRKHGKQRRVVSIPELLDVIERQS